MLDLTSLNLDPPVISISDATPEDIACVVEQYELKSSEISLLRSLVEINHRTNRAYCTSKEVVSFLNLSSETIRKSLISLVERGIFEKIECKTKSGTRRKAYLYRIKVSSIPTIITSQSPLDISGESKLRSLVAPNDEVFGKVDELIFKLAPCLEHSHKSNEKSKKAIIYVKEEPINVLIEASGNNVIARVRDIRFYVAILRLCLDLMKQRYTEHLAGEIEMHEVMNTEFPIAESDLLRSMNLDTGSASREHAYNSINRLDATTYKILSAPASFMEQHSLADYIAKIGHFRLRKYAKTKSDRVAYLIELSSSQVQSLYAECISEHASILLQVDHRIFTERNPLLFIFTFYTSTIEAGSIRKYTWQSLKDNIAPNLPIRDFKVSLSKLLFSNKVAQYASNGEELDYIQWSPDGKTLESIIAKFNSIEVTVTKDAIYVTKDINYQRMTVNKRINSAGASIKRLR